MLIEGEVDAVALNEFTGRTAIKDMGLRQTVAPVQTRPLSIEGLHVLVHKSHPDAQNVMAAVNQGLAAIKENGLEAAQYQVALKQVEALNALGKGEGKQTILLPANALEAFGDAFKMLKGGK